MQQYEDRFRAESYDADEPICVGTGRPGGPPGCQADIPDSLFARAQLIAQAYKLHLLPIIDYHRETRLNRAQCDTLCEELLFIGNVVNDDLVRLQIRKVLAVVEESLRSPGDTEVVIEGP
jgi:hypothetical protein